MSARTEDGGGAPRPPRFHGARRLVDKVFRRVLSVKPTRSLEEWERSHAGKVRESVEAILPFLPDDGVFLDIGCNIGSFTRSLRTDRPRARGVLFEPVAEYAAIARERLGGDPLLDIHQVGLGNETSDRTIYKPAHNYGGNSIVEEIMFDTRPNTAVLPGTVMTEETVHIHDACDWLLENDPGRIDVIKSDTEGYDWAVLESLHRWCVATGQRPTIFVEVFTARWHPFADRQQAAIDAFVGLGYGDVDIESTISGICGDVLLVHPSARRADEGAA